VKIKSLLIQIHNFDISVSSAFAHCKIYWCCS